MTHLKARKNRKKMAIVFFFLTLIVLVILIIRFSKIMITDSVDGQDLGRQVENLYTQEQYIPAKRGSILDKNGESIAVSSTSYKMMAVLTDEWSQNKNQEHHVVDKEHTAEVLSRYIALDKKDILDRLNQDNVKQVEFGPAASNLSYDTKKKIEDENLPGIIFEEKPSRLYPNGVFASHLVGIAQTDPESKDNKLYGVMGLEDSLQSILAGEDGGIRYERDIFGYAIPNGQAEQVEAKDGRDVYLTLDKSIQMYMESVVSKVNRSNPSVAITATLMDPKTGKILAATQRPSFNATNKENIEESWQNYHVEYTLEPGSTMKILTLAAAVNEGLYKPSETFMSGSYSYAGSTINDWKPEGWGEITYLDGLSVSSNVAFVKLFEKMGSEKWKHYLDEFGFGQKTGVQLPNENTGSNPYSTAIQQANTAFGQGITVTPMQMMQAFSAIGNGGKMMKLQLVEKYVDPNTGEERVIEPELAGQPISKDAAQETLGYLKEAGDQEESTTSIFHIEGYDLALKTGTSEIADPKTGSYMTGENNSIYSAVGFAPADDPQYVLYVTVQQPELSNENVYGSHVVRDIFNPIMKWTLDQSELGHALNTENIKEGAMPSLTSKPLEEALSLLQEKGEDPIIIGSGDTVVQQYPFEYASLSNDQEIILMTNGAMSMPDLTGLSKTEALKVSEMTGVEFNFEGTGYIYNQDVEVGRPIDGSEEVNLKLSENKNA